MTLPKLGDFYESSVSMLPLILPTDRLIVRSNRKVRVNDIVVFEKKKRLIAHRVVYKPNTERYIVTKGDNNLDDDGNVSTDNILGTVNYIVRKNEKIKIDDLYLIQSVAYLKEISRVIKKLEAYKINYVILKGFPVHYFVESSLPRRILLDLDLLVSKKDYKLVQKMVTKSGFKMIFEKGKRSSQTSFVKNRLPYPVLIDLHNEAAVGFTRALDINDMLLDVNKFSNSLLEETKIVKLNGTAFQILKEEYLLVFLLLHFFHHNFRGAYRMDLIVNLAKKGVSMEKMLSIIHDNYFEGQIFPAVSVVCKYYKSNNLQILKKNLNVPIYQKLVTLLVSYITKPFSEGTKNFNRAARFFFVYIFSPKKTAEKIGVLFSGRFVTTLVKSLNVYLRGSNRAG